MPGGPKLNAARIMTVRSSTANVIAVQLYLGLGFQPQPRSEAELAVWEELRGCLAPRFAALLETIEAPL